MSVAVAVPFDPYQPEKLATIVTQCCLHRNWFSDFDWALGEPHRREQVLARLSAQHSRSWEVYRDGVLVGLLHADEIVPRVSCNCHFLFYDRDLRSKRSLCLNTMAYLFEKYDLHTLRVQIPSYAAKLIGFVRKALGFRFEAEQRIFSWPSSASMLSPDVAKLGSRLHQAILHEGVWHDLLLLSVTRDEFESRQKAPPLGTESDSTQAHRTLA